MSTPKFITLTEDGLKTRVNAEHISRYRPSSGGAKVEASGIVTWYAETPEQIDAMLGVTERAEAIAAALEAEAARMDDDATAIHNGTMGGDMKLRAKAFRDAAKIARATGTVE